MNSGLTWKKRFVSLFVVSFVAAVAGPALADETAPKADLDPMNGCIGTYCPGDESKESPKAPTCRTVCKSESKGKPSTCHQVCN